MKKTILSLILCLATVGLFAAIQTGPPTSSSSGGSSGIPTLNGSGTNTSLINPLFQVVITNGVIDTNTLVVSGAGTGAANGTYTWTSGQSAYVLDANNIIYFSTFWKLSNSVNGLQSYLTTGPNLAGNGTWARVTGTNPAPVVVWGTNANTNTFPPFTQSYNGPLFYLDSANGNDTNSGATWSQARATLKCAITNCPVGGTIMAAKGVYAASGVIFKYGVNFIGAGSGLTILTNDGGFQTSISFTGSNYFANCYSYCYFSSGITFSGTPIIFNNVVGGSEEDGVFTGDANHWYFYNCRLGSQYDTFNITGTGWTGDAWGCEFKSALVTNATHPVRTIQLSAGNLLRLYGCSVICSNATSTNVTGGIVFENTTGGTVEASGTRFEVQDSAGTGYVMAAQSATTTGTVKFYGCQTDATSTNNPSITVSNLYTVPASTVTGTLTNNITATSSIVSTLTVTNTVTSSNFVQSANATNGNFVFVGAAGTLYNSNSIPGFTTTNALFNAGNCINVAHNLGTTPRFVRCVVVCVTNDTLSGCLVGDECDSSGWMFDDGAFAATQDISPLITFGANTTNVYAAINGNITNSASSVVLNKVRTGGVVSPSTMNNFRVKIYAHP